MEANELVLLFIEQTPDEWRPSYEPSRCSLLELLSELDVCTSDCARESEDVTNVDDERGDSFGKFSVIWAYSWFSGPVLAYVSRVTVSEVLFPARHAQPRRVTVCRTATQIKVVITIVHAAVNITAPINVL